MEDKVSYSDNSNTYLKLKVKKQYYNLHGYSRAGSKTCIICPDLNIVFDYGYADERAYSMRTKLISHGHCDHIGALHTDHSSRRLNHLENNTRYIMPLQCINPYKMLVSAYSHMDIGRYTNQINMITTLLNTELVAAEMCNKYHLENNIYCSAFEMDHKVKSFGYIIYRKSNRLKAEYIGLEPKEIINLKKTEGIILTEEHYEPLVGYTGDTTINGLIKNPDFFSVPLLIMECTGFSSDDIIECQLGYHTHIDDIARETKRFNNEKIVLFHFSQKYKDVKKLEDKVSLLDDDLQDKIRLFY